MKEMSCKLLVIGVGPGGYVCAIRAGQLGIEPMLAHRASAQGMMVAEIIAGKKRSWDKVCIPAVCFTDPEIVVAGLTPEEASACGIELKTALFPFQANGRAMTLENE